jgi:hypothetical protein
MINTFGLDFEKLVSDNSKQLSANLDFSFYDLFHVVQLSNLYASNL